MKSTKISVVSLICVMIIGATSVFALANQIDKVIITEEVLFGDVNTNFTLNMKTTMENLHIWDIKTPVGNAENSDVDYKLLNTYQYVNGEISEYVYIQFLGNYSTSTSGIFDLNELDQVSFEYPNDFRQPTLAIKDVASRTENNSTHTETINLSDYYEFYPIQHIQNDAGYFSTDAFTKIKDYFKIPTRDDKYKITIEKNNEGVNRIELDSVGVTTVIRNISTVIDNEVFLALEVQEINGNDLTRIGGTEVYRFDVFEENDYIEIGEISKIKTFDEGIYINDFIKYGDFIVAIETDGAKSNFVVYSKDGFTEIQRISLEGNVYSLEKIENALLVHHADEIFTVLTEENGVFSVEYDVKFETLVDEEIGKYYYNPKKFFIDNNLIVLMEYRNNDIALGDIIMTVYNENGLEFGVRYSISQARGNPHYHNESIRLEDFYVE